MSEEQDQTQPTPISKPKRQSREGRFLDAAQEALDAVMAARESYADAKSAYETARNDIEDAFEVLRSVQTEYEDLYEHLGDGSEVSDLAEALEEIIDINLDPIIPEFEEPDLSDAEDAARECLAVKLPTS